MLIRRSGEEVLADMVLKEVDVVCFYFSAHWCPPCRMFTPTLADFYAELKEKEERVEIVFVSSDRNVQDMMAYMREDHGDWLAVPFGDRLGQVLKIKYRVQGIPTLVVVTNEGTLITREGLTEMHAAGTNCYKLWILKKRSQETNLLLAASAEAAAEGTQCFVGQNV